MPLTGGPVPPIGGPCAAERRPLCREEALCAGRYSVLRGLKEAVCREEVPVPRGGPLYWKVLSSVLKGLKETPVLGGGSLCRMVRLLYAEGTAGGPYAERRPSMPRGPLC